MLMEDKRAWDLMPGHYKYTNTVYLEKGQKKKIACYSLIFKIESLPWDFTAFEVFFPRLPELLRR